MGRIFRALASVLFVILSACSDGGRTGINPDDKAPNIKGLDLNGNPISLDQIQGKVILLNFWATWCSPCIAELPALQRLYTNLKEHGVQVVGIAVDDSPENIKAAQATYGMTYPIIIDTDSQSKRFYEVKGLPESFVLNGEHRIQVLIDPDGNGPVTRIVGPREWSEKRVAEMLTSLIK